jgi:lipoate-protein ligase A
VVEGRNDITAEGRKFSGLAQYAVKNKLCSHGSLLYNSDLDMLARLLNPDPEKIISKAVSSVKSRVVNISKYFNPKISTDEFLARLKSNLFEETETKTENYEFTEHDIKQINIIRSEKYANPDWTNGASPKFSFHGAKRFPAGKIEVFLDVERGIIKPCKIFGDFLGIYPVESLEEKLINQPHEFGILSDILAKTDLRFYFGGIKPEELLECLF